MQLPVLSALGASPAETLWRLAFALVVFALARLYWVRGRRRYRLRVQAARAARGEDRAELLLARAGWAIEGRQVSQSFEVKVDGQPAGVLVRADFVVTRGGRRYVAEVKTGRFAPRIETSATRRQLLEYRIAYDVDGVLLVDAETDRISFVEFPRVVARPTWTPVWWVVSGSVLAAAVALFFR